MSIERSVAQPLKAYSQLEELHPGAVEGKQIANARSATQEYGKALQAWVGEYQRDAHSTAVEDFSKIMNRAGDTLSQLIDDRIRRFPATGRKPRISSEWCSSNSVINHLRIAP